MDKHIDMLGKIKSREDFLEFMDSFKSSIDDETLKDYMDSLAAWTESMDGYYHNTGKDMPKDINWDFIATSLYAGSIYE